MTTVYLWYSVQLISSVVILSIIKMLKFGPLWCRHGPISPLSQTQGIFSSLDLLRLRQVTRIHLAENYSTGSSSHVPDAAEVPKTVVTDTDRLAPSLAPGINIETSTHDRWLLPWWCDRTRRRGPHTNQSPTVICLPCWVMSAQLMDWLRLRRDANGQLYGRQHLEPAVTESRGGRRVKSIANVHCIRVFCFWNWYFH